MSPRPFTLSIVVPCYNEEASLAALESRLEGLSFPSLELVPVDDGSSDATWKLLTRWAQRSGLVTAVKLKGNHGNQAAILSGLSAARGTAVAVLDADLQDPPELLEPMVKMMEEQGLDAVLGLKTRREDEGPWASFAKSLALSVLPFHRGEGDFCLLSDSVAKALLSAGGPSTPFRVRRRRALKGLKVGTYGYDRDSRGAGTTKFSLPKLARLWWRLFLGCYLPFLEPSATFRPPIETILRR